MYLRNVTAILLGLLAFLSSNAYAQLIPPDRIITWQGNVGVEGGIPERSNLRD